MLQVTIKPIAGFYLGGGGGGGNTLGLNCAMGGERGAIHYSTYTLSNESDAVKPSSTLHEAHCRVCVLSF